jgi:hypothetical protein
MGLRPARLTSLQRRVPAPPRPWHVLLSPALPILALLAGNYGSLYPQIAIWSLAVAIGLAVCGWLVLTQVVGTVRTSALAISFLSLAFLSQADITQVARTVGMPQAVPLTPVFSVILSLFILRYRGPAQASTTFVNALLLVTTAFVAWPIGTSVVQRWNSPTQPYSALEVRDSGRPDRPDIYIVILDGYARADVLHDYYQFDNTLPPDLQALGFTVAAEAASNYAQTAQSLSSSLNLEYLQTLLQRQGAGVSARQRFADFITDNRTFRTLSAAGYRIRAYASEYGLIRPAEADDRPHPWLYLRDFEYGVYEASMLPLISILVGVQPNTWPAMLHRHHIRWTLDHLEREIVASGSPPTLVFAHLMIPHPPFSFEADGRALTTELPANMNDGSHWRARAEAAGSNESYEASYVKSLRFLNSRILDIVRRVSSRADGRRTIFYIQGDHGPGSRLDWNDPDRTDARERLGILLAARFPTELPTSTMYPSITPVNALRILLNNALGTDLPMLEDRSYFSPWPDPLQFIDVTERVRQ